MMSSHFLQWALIELSRHPETQARLREELTTLANASPSFDQLTTGLPYLDAVFREVLRLHPPVQFSQRIAVVDDILPLGAPLTTASGDVVDQVVMPKGTTVLVPIHAVNTSEMLWGADAKEWKPERWLEDEKGIPKRAKEIQGYHHVLSFIEGQRMCLGRVFAVTEFKVSGHSSVLVFT